jgi:hypothetical protein
VTEAKSGKEDNEEREMRKVGGVRWKKIER